MVLQCEFLYFNFDMYVTRVFDDYMQDVVIVDCRSVFDFTECHITGAVNLACSTLMRRRLQQNTVRSCRAGSCPAKDRSHPIAPLFQSHWSDP